jgi:Asp-tRNA(Asn)/Glu-tRNA(Gln) amidotransferase B subunit
MNEKDLKERLILKRKNELNINPDEMNELIVSMLNHIGSTDPELRDELIYYSISKWIVENQISDEVLNKILTKCLNNLSHGLGETETDTVFTRSFSILIVTSILYYHNHIRALLPKKEVQDVCRIAIHYSLSENDLRGYVMNKGWAHSVAHLADCLDELAKCTYLVDKEIKQILNVIQSKVKTDHILYAFGEDERLVTAVISVFSRGDINIETKLEWL